MIPGMAEPEPTVTFDADVLGRDRGGEETMVRGLLDGLASIDLPFRVLAYMRDPAAFTARGRVPPVALPVRSNYARVAVALPRQLRATGRRCTTAITCCRRACRARRC